MAKLVQKKMRGTGFVYKNVKIILGKYNID